MNDIEEYVQNELPSAGGLPGDIVSMNPDLQSKVSHSLGFEVTGNVRSYFQKISKPDSDKADRFPIAVLHFELLRETTS